MRLIDAQARLLELDIGVFHTSDAAALLGVSRGHSSKILSRLSKAGLLVHLGRGLWAFKDKVEPLSLPQYLTNPFPSYISLQTALYQHGMISQIPVVIYAVSVARTKRFTTPLGTVSVHHVAPSFFFGYEKLPGGDAKIASPEKALIDFFYLSPARSKLFRSLPELELPKGFKVREARRMISKVRSPRRRKRVLSLFKDIVSGG